MDAGEDIIDVLYKYRDYSNYPRYFPPHLRRQESTASSTPGSLSPTPSQQQQRRQHHHGRRQQQQQQQQQQGRFATTTTSALVHQDSDNSSSVADRGCAQQQQQMLQQQQSQRRSVRADIIYQDEEDPYFLARRRRHELVELPNGVRIRPRTAPTTRSASQQNLHQQKRRAKTLPRPPRNEANFAGLGNEWMLQNNEESDYVVTQSDIGYSYDKSRQIYENTEQYEQGQSRGLDDWRRRLGEDDGQDVYCSIAGSGAGVNLEGAEGPCPEDPIATMREDRIQREEPIYISQKTQTDDEMTKVEETKTKSSSSGPRPNPNMTFLRAANFFFGLSVMVYLSYKWSAYLAQLHDNQFWFVNIKEVEREISFRTEQGLYYSYFKHLVNAPTLAQGIEQLKRDNTTEHLRTINIFHRFNIHQELFLAALYRWFDLGLRPILFYVYFVFSLQGFFLAVLFALSWVLSGTWAAGVVTAAYVVVHRLNVTRVEFTIALREHFSLPFIFAQFAAVGIFLDNKDPKKEKLHLISVFTLTFLFTLTWQFAQFVLLLQSCVLLGLALLQILDKRKVSHLLLLQLASVLCVWHLQHRQPMVLLSLVVSLIPVALIVLNTNLANPVPKRGFVHNVARATVVGLGALVTAVVANSSIKMLLGQRDDNHIYRFLQNKFGGSALERSPDFETRLYLCLPIFQSIGWQFYHDMSQSFAMQLYLLFAGFGVICVALTVFKRWSPNAKNEDKNKDFESRFLSLFDGDLHFMANMSNRPGLCFHIAQSSVLALLAISTLRMKCFWSPYIAVFASVQLANRDLWTLLMTKLAGKENVGMLVEFVRHLVLAAVLVTLYVANSGAIYEELEVLREFWDPDTVELMEWINSLKLPVGVAFTGSMQLLAGVKLCTGVSLTNHPHFEDTELRQRTRELYDIYAKLPPEQVHATLTKYNSSYIILEDSICLASRRHERCNLPTTMDLVNGHIPDDGVRDPPHLVRSEHPRFCDEIRKGKPSFAPFFKKVFENQTFRVYKVLPK